MITQEPKFTPAPWDKVGNIIIKYEPVCCGGYDAEDGSCCGSPAAEPNFIVECTYEPNTHLISAAPEMYGILASPEFQEMIELSFERGGRLKELAKILNPQRMSALKKARGEA